MRQLSAGDQMTKILTTIGHHKAFNNEQNLYPIAIQGPNTTNVK